MSKNRISIKAFSLWEPWASAMMLGLKKNETRSYFIKHRGPLVICAAKSSEGLYGMNPDLHKYFAESGLGTTVSWPLGCALGIVDVVDCIGTDYIRSKLASPGAFGSGSVTAEMYLKMELNMRTDLFITLNAPASLGNLVQKTVRITGAAGVDLGAPKGHVILFDNANNEYVAEEDDILEVHTMELDFGDYSNGRYALITKNLRRFKQPVPFKGAQGLFDYDGPLDFEKPLTAFEFDNMLNGHFTS